MCTKVFLTSREASSAVVYAWGCENFLIQDTPFVTAQHVFSALLVKITKLCARAHGIVGKGANRDLSSHLPAIFLREDKLQQILVQPRVWGSITTQLSNVLPVMGGSHQLKPRHWQCVWLLYEAPSFNSWTGHVLSHLTRFLFALARLQLR